MHSCLSVYVYVLLKPAIFAVRFSTFLLKPVFFAFNAIKGGILQSFVDLVIWFLSFRDPMNKVHFFPRDQAFLDICRTHTFEST